jgi:hypothetical protein
MPTTKTNRSALPKPAHVLHTHSSIGNIDLFTGDQMHAFRAEGQQQSTLLAGDPVAWRYVPSEAWKEAVFTDKPERVKLASSMGLTIEALYTRAQPQAETEMRAILQELHDKFNRRVYGTSSYIKRDMRDRIAEVLAARAQPQADAAEPVAAVLAAIADYDAALKRREHGGVAMSKAFDAIRSAVEAQAPGARGEGA